MESRCVVVSARWAATLRIAKPGEYLSDGPHVSVKIECYGDEFTEYGISRTVKEAFREFPKNCKVELLTLLEKFRGEPLTEWDLMNLKFLLRVTNDLAAHLLEGGSATNWCDALGLEPHRGSYTFPPGRKLPRPLFIWSDFEEYILTSQRYFYRRKKARLGAKR